MRELKNTWTISITEPILEFWMPAVAGYLLEKKDASQSEIPGNKRELVQYSPRSENYYKTHKNKIKGTKTNTVGVSLYFMEELKLINSKGQTPSTKRYELTMEGKKYAHDWENQPKILHFQLLRYNSWYKQTILLILKEGSDIFSSKKLHEKLVIDSIYRYGVPRYDGNTFRNVLNCLKFTKVIIEENINNEKKLKIIKNINNTFFNENFKKIALELIPRDNYELTYKVCQQLFDKRNEFMLGYEKTVIDISFILEQLIELSNEEIEFVAGITPPPIPAHLALVRRRE